MKVYSMEKFFSFAIFIFIAACSPMKGTNSGLVLSDTVSGENLFCEEGGQKPGPNGIVGGESLSQDGRIARSTVMLLMTTADDKSKICTGTVISSQMVLTAAHCVLDEKAQLIAKVEVFFTNRYSCYTAAPKTSILGTVLYNDFVPNSMDMLSNSKDVALVKLASRVPNGYIPMPIAGEDEYPGMDESFYVAGYGQFLEDIPMKAQAGVLRFTEMKNIHLKDYQSRLREIFNPESSMEVYEAEQKEKGICFGDSGGPAMMSRNGKLKQFAINSAVIGGELQPDGTWSKATCREGSRYASIDRNREWLREAFNKLMGGPSKENPF